MGSYSHIKILFAEMIAGLAAQAFASPIDDVAFHDMGNAHTSPFHGRVIFAVALFIMMCGLSGMLATRLKVLRPHHYRCLTPIRILTILSYVLALLFLFASGLLLSAWDLSTHHVCYVGTQLCLAFYVSSKVILCTFLLERAVMIRNTPRRRDPYYLIGVFVIVAGLGTIAIIAFIGPVATVSKVDDMCRIGLPLKAVISLLIYDVLINIGLTGLYIKLANRIVKNLTWGAVGRVTLGALPFHNYGPLPSQASILQLMMAKSILATLAVILVTAVNLVVLIVMRGKEQAWLCLTICCLDVFWSVVIIHWLTSNPLVDYGDQPKALHSKTTVSADRVNHADDIRIFERI